MFVSSSFRFTYSMKINEHLTKLELLWKSTRKKNPKPKPLTKSKFVIWKYVLLLRFTYHLLLLFIIGANCKCYVWVDYIEFLPCWFCGMNSSCLISPVSFVFNVWLDSFFVSVANNDCARGGISGGAGSGGGSSSLKNQNKDRKKNHFFF